MGTIGKILVVVGILVAIGYILGIIKIPVAEELSISNFHFIQMENKFSCILK